MRLLCFFFCLMPAIAGAQSFFETRWTSDGLVYHGLLIFHSDKDATMRVRYYLNGSYKVAAFECRGEHFEEDGVVGYLLDGRDAQVVYGDDGSGYSADNFIFTHEGGIHSQYGTPFHIDDQTLKKDHIKDNMVAVDYWRPVNTSAFTEALVRNFFEKSEPLYHTLMAYNTGEARVESRKGDYRITNLGFGEGKWVVSMSRGTGIGQQSWELNPSFPSEWINEKWDDGFYINALAFGNGQWSVAMARETGYTSQSWRTEAAFPKSWIKEKWDARYYITSVGFGGGSWAVVMSRGKGYTGQTYKVDASFPADWIQEQWNAGYHITSLSFGNGSWAVVMTRGSGMSSQTWKTDAAFPTDWIKEKWDTGHDITEVAAGNGLWAMVMSKGTAITGQTWKTSTNYPSDWIQAKWDGPVTPEPVHAAEGIPEATIHLVLVANTTVSDIGESCTADRDHVLEEFATIAEVLEMNLSKTVVEGKNFRKSSVTAALNGLNPRADDIVVFVYSGHGFRFSNQPSSYPNLDLRSSTYGTMTTDDYYSLEAIYHLVRGKGARLNLVLGDCCNALPTQVPRTGEASLAARHLTIGKADRLRQLFTEAEGTLLATAAKPEQTSCGNSREGGIFLSSFFAALNKETSQLSTGPPQWETLISNAFETATYKTQNLQGCGVQHGIYYSTVK
jgi:hypothetical protein